MRTVLFRLEWEHLVKILPHTGILVAELELNTTTNVFQARLYSLTFRLWCFNMLKMHNEQWNVEVSSIKEALMSLAELLNCDSPEMVGRARKDHVPNTSSAACQPSWDCRIFEPFGFCVRPLPTAVSYSAPHFAFFRISGAP